MRITVGARDSTLSKCQVEEVLAALKKYHPDISFDLCLVKTQGDLDLKTALSTLGRTAFFTKEIDQMLLQNECQVAIHSAKDLPAPLPLGLSLIALTEGIGSKDVLVLNPNLTLTNREKPLKIGTSSLRREVQIKQIFPHCICKEIRGTVPERLAQIGPEFDGVIVAEAALSRLKIVPEKVIVLPGRGAAFQGQLAILAREGDEKMEALFSCIDRKKGVFYPGLKKGKAKNALHCPLINIVSRDLTSTDIAHFISKIPKATHLLFTSQEAVKLFFQAHQTHHYPSLNHLKGIAVGEFTAMAMKKEGMNVSYVPRQASQEGIIQLLEQSDFQKAQILWPHSALSRHCLKDYLLKKDVLLEDCVFYDTETKQDVEPPCLKNIDEIVFTSPSVVDAFISFYGKLPEDKILKAIGPVTYKKMSQYDSTLSS